MPPRLSLFFSFMLVALGAPRVLAGDLGTVVLDKSPPADFGAAWPEAEQRTRAELATMGLSVVEVDTVGFGAESPVAGLAAAARAHRAVAALRLLRSTESPGVDIWLLDDVTGKTTTRRVSTEHLAPSEAVALVALSVVELLNASLLELRAGYSPRGPAPPTEGMLRMVDRNLEITSAPYRLALRAGAAVLGSPGGLGLMAGPAVSVGWGLLPNLAVESDLLLTALETKTDGRPGTAHFGLGMGRLQVVLRTSRSRRWQPHLGLGGGVVVAWARGAPEGSYSASTDLTTVAVASMVAGVTARVSRSLRIRIALGAGMTIPKLSLALAGEPTATVGHPLVDGIVGLEWIWTGEAQ